MSPFSALNHPNPNNDRHTESFALFNQPNLIHGDPFAQISQPTEYDAGVRTSFTGIQPDVGRPLQSLPSYYESPQANYRESEHASMTTKPENVQSNPYRITGKSQYAMPSPYMGQSYSGQPAQEWGVGVVYTGQPAQGSSVGSLLYTGQPQLNSVAREHYNYPPMSNASMPQSVVSQEQNEYSSVAHSIHPPALPQSLAGTPQTYQPTQHHWFYCKKITSREIWRPFSVSDSRQLEQVIKLNGQGGSVINVDGGRYNVDVQRRERSAAYWMEPRSIVRRCSWFFQADGDKHFVPYDERFAVHLEDCYKSTLLSGDFHKKLLCPGGETIVIHSPQVILHYSGAGELDAWGNTANESRPKVVKRGVDDLEDVAEDVMGHVDHLVLVVHGIGANSHTELEKLVDCVNDMRSVSNQIIRSHFKTAPTDQRIGRVEYLPVIWQQQVHASVVDINSTLKSVTLKSIGKLRNFTNDTLLDVLFYGSPMFSQSIIDAVSEELNRLYELFVSRNPLFVGQISLAGHSLGAVILFDILKQQHPAGTSVDNQPSLITSTQKTGLGPPLAQVEPVMVGDHTQTLASVLSQLGLSSFLEHFEREQIDLASLSLLEDNDIRDMGLPLGPRKKLQDFMKKFAENEAKKQMYNNTEINHNTDKSQVVNTMPNSEPLLKSSSNTHVTYELGTGGVGTPFVNFLSLKFQPSTFFALGSPLAMFLTIRGVTILSEDFALPTCLGFYNIFHPFDPTAYRMEPMLISSCPSKPVLIPHHKGRKRLHLELRDSLTRMGSDLKQRIIESVKTTWRSINSFALSHRSEAQNQEYLETEVDSVLCELSGNDNDEASNSASSSSGVPGNDEEFCSSRLNRGHRIDFVLQEKPIEIFNEYLFALGSHTCYWESEDTLLLMLKDMYALMGIVPLTPSSNVASLASGMLPFGGLTASGPPPQSGFISNKASLVKSAQDDITVMPRPFQDHVNHPSFLFPPGSHSDYPDDNAGVLLSVIKAAGSQEIIDGSEIEALNDSRSVPVPSRVRMLGPPLAPVIPAAPWQSVSRPFTPNAASKNTQ